jgi:hypothetical protein
MALTPSYDFSLFDLPSFNPLTAEEFGASTSFSAADPTQWVDNSLNTLSSYLQPFNPLPYLSNQFPYITPDLITPQAPQTFFQTPMGTPSRSVLLGGQTGSGTTVNVNVPGSMAQAQAAVDKAKTEAQAALQYAQGACARCQAFNAQTSGQKADCTAACAGIGSASIDNQASGNNPVNFLDSIGLKSLSDWLSNLPPNTGLLLLGVAVIILILLFVRRKNEA